MNALRRNMVLMGLMIAASGLAMAFVPTHRIADDGKRIDLEAMIPRQFGGWAEMPGQTHQIIDPQQQQMIERLYSQTLSRTYSNQAGDHIMLSIAYGAEQSDAKALHYPEVCYPAQGFQVLAKGTSDIRTGYGVIRAKRVMTVKGSRSEPVTYWATVGNTVVRGGKETKLEQLRYGLRGDIPDGLLFRVSSVSSGDAVAFATQEKFINQLLEATSPETRKRLAGLGASTESKHE